MSIKLPEPIAAYFAASNKHDIDAMLVPFSATTIVTDESQQRSGLAAIREWIEETTTKYRPTAIITAVARKDGDTIVTARVSGTFPGSPIDIRYSFTLKDEKIARLDIG
jgi:hypothetical protein